MNIDAHVHLLPEAVRKNPAAVRERDPWFAACFPKGAVMADTDQLVKMLDENSLDACIVAGWSFRSIDDCHSMTDAGVQARNVDARIASLAMIHPLDPHIDDALDDAKRRGCCGVGEVNADGFGIGDDRFLFNLAEGCADRELPLLLHCSEPVGHQYPGKGTFAPERVERLLRAVPACTVILAHLGGGVPLYAAMPEVKQLFTHAYVDTAAGPWLYEPDILTQVADTIGWNRIMFGSDFPLLNQHRYIEWTSSGKLTVPEEFWGNTAARVFRIQSGQENVG
ncbi:MAG: amidohydrolase family protein [Candidatus Dormibacteria bacterium]